MHRAIFFILLFTISILSAEISSQRIAIMEIVTDESAKDVFTDKQLQRATQYLYSKLAGKLDIINQTQLKEVYEDMIEEGRIASRKECVDDGCRIELGKSASANYNLNSRITQFAGTCTFTVEMVNLKTTMVEQGNASAVDFHCDINGLKAAIITVSALLTGGIVALPPQRKVVATPQRRAPPPKQKVVRKQKVAQKRAETPPQKAVPASKDRPVIRTFQGFDIGYGTAGENGVGFGYHFEFSPFSFFGWDLHTTMIYAPETEYFDVQFSTGPKLFVAFGRFVPFLSVGGNFIYAFDENWSGYGGGIYTKLGFDVASRGKFAFGISTEYSYNFGLIMPHRFVLLVRLGY